MIARTHEEIELQIREIQSKKKRLINEGKDKVGLGESGFFDSDIYDNKGRFEGYSKSISVNVEIDDDEDDVPTFTQKQKTVYTASTALLKEIAITETDCDPFSNKYKKTVAEKEDEYRQRHRRLVISPERIDPFTDGAKKSVVGSRTYKDVMHEQLLKREENELRSKLITKAKKGTLKRMMHSEDKTMADKKKSIKKERDASMNKKSYKRSRSSSNSSHYTDSDNDNPKEKHQKAVRNPEESHHRRKHHKHHKKRSENSSSEDDSRYKSRDQNKNDRQRDTSLFGTVKVKEEPLSEDERGRKLKNRVTVDSSHRGDARNLKEDSRRRNDNLDSKDQNQRSRKPAKEQLSDKEPEWGKKVIKTENKEPPKNSAKPDFGLSGKLTEDANTYNGVVIKYIEPPEARKPKRRWRLYPFKGEQTLPVLHIHRQSAYLLGRDRKVADIPIDHPSCSKQHAALQYRLVPFTRTDGSKGRQIKLYVIDLESANGTYLNNQKIEVKKYYELKERDVIKFGYSSREYVLLHEHSKDSGNDDDVNNDD